MEAADRQTSLLREGFDDEAETFLSHAEEETRVLQSFGEGSATSSEWANAITASLLLSLCSLVGILLFSNSFFARKISLPLAFMLSSGALLTTAFVHVIPEAIRGLEGEGNFKTMSTRAGITLFAGMSVGLILHGLSPACWNVILGDLTHNFADGVTIGAAFLGCNSTVGWTVAAASMLHEIPHELANFMVLVNGGMSVTQALLYNFLSAMFSILGAILVLAMKDWFTQAGISMVLLFGAGTFIFVGLAELVPDALADSESTTGIKSSQRGGQLKVFVFFVGALILGLPLLMQSDCEFE